MRYMKILYFLSFLTISLTPAIAGNWYEGGSLHNSTAQIWKASSYENKLATAADWAIKAPKIKATVRRSGNINTLRKYAVELVSCVDTTVNGAEISDETPTIAASCMILLGWLK